MAFRVEIARICNRGFVLIQTLLLLSSSTQASVGDKFASLMKSPQGYQSEYRLEINGARVANGIVARKAPQYFEFTAKGNGFSYKFVLTPTKANEFEHVDKEYFEFGPIEGMFAPSGTFSAIPVYAIPVPVLLGSFGSLLKSVKPIFKEVGSETIEGIPSTHFKVTGAAGEVDAWFASDGRLTRYDQPQPQGDGTVIYYKFFFKNHTTSPTVTFDAEPPIGYSAAALAKPNWPLEIATPFRADDWEDARGNPVKLSFTKPVLFVVVREDCPISGRLKPLLDQLKGKVRVISVSPDGKVPMGLVFEMSLKPSKGTMYDRLHVQGTPSFMLVGKDGKVKWLDQGFVIGTEEEVATDLLSKLK